ncbi:MAG: inositol monophosphatase family protein, partial [Pseudomonadota bacterium]
VSAVIHDPVKDETFWAEKGAGAWLDGRSRLRVSGRRDMLETVYATGLPWGGGKYLPATLQDLGRLLPVCAGVRRWGAAALDLAYVAAGRYDGYWERGVHPWDIAAGILIVREAGGMVEPLRPDQSLLEDGQVIAGSGAIFDRFAGIIRTRP